MAGVELRSSAPRSDDNTRITAGPMRDWGAVEGFCFEGSNCVWDVRGAYGPRLLRRDTCGLNGFGGDDRGFVLNTRHGGERQQ